MVIKYLTEAASFDELGQLETEIENLSSEILDIEREAHRVSYSYESNFHLLPEADAEEAKALDSKISQLRQKIWDLKNQYEEYNSVYDRYEVRDRDLEAKLKPEIDAARAEIDALSKDLDAYKTSMRDLSNKAAAQLRVDRDVEGKKASKEMKITKHAELISKLVAEADLDWVAECVKTYIEEELAGSEDVTVTTTYISRDSDDRPVITLSVKCSIYDDDVYDYVDIDSESIEQRYFDHIERDFLDLLDGPNLSLYKDSESGDQDEYIFNSVVSFDIKDNTDVRYYNSPATQYDAYGDPGDPDMSEIEIFGDIGIDADVKLTLIDVDKS